MGTEAEGFADEPMPGMPEPAAKPEAPSAARWRKRPVVIEARRFDPAADDALAVCQWSGAKPSDEGCDIETLEGVMTAAPGDWIIKGTAGEFYPCKPDVFEQVYEPAGDAPDPAAEPRYAFTRTEIASAFVKAGWSAYGPGEQAALAYAVTAQLVREQPGNAVITCLRIDVAQQAQALAGVRSWRDRYLADWAGTAPGAALDAILDGPARGTAQGVGAGESP